jgi:hypothetical protein
VPTTNPSYAAYGNITLSSFVKIDTNNNHAVLQAGNNSSIVGISQEGSQLAPFSGASPLSSQAGSSLAAIGNATLPATLRVYGLGEECLLMLGNNTIRGQFLRSDSTGNGTPAETTGNVSVNIGALALESGSAGEKIRVQVQTRKDYSTP